MFRHGQARVASARRAYEEITSAVTNSFLLGKIDELGSPGLAMTEVRRMYVPSDDLDRQSHLREYINAAMVPGEKPETYFRANDDNQGKTGGRGDPQIGPRVEPTHITVPFTRLRGGQKDPAICP